MNTKDQQKFRRFRARQANSWENSYCSEHGHHISTITEKDKKDMRKLNSTDKLPLSDAERYVPNCMPLSKLIFVAEKYVRSCSTMSPCVVNPYTCCLPLPTRVWFQYWCWIRKHDINQQPPPMIQIIAHSSPKPEMAELGTVYYLLLNGSTQLVFDDYILPREMRTVQYDEKGTSDAVCASKDRHKENGRVHFTIKRRSSKQARGNSASTPTRYTNAFARISVPDHNGGQDDGNHADPQLSQYEQDRLSNIAADKKLFESIGIKEAVTAVQAAHTKSKSNSKSHPGNSRRRVNKPLRMSTRVKTSTVALLSPPMDDGNEQGIISKEDFDKIELEYGGEDLHCRAAFSSHGRWE